MPVPKVSSIGPIITRGTVERAFLTLLQQWLGTYLSEVEAQNGLADGTVPRPPSPASFYGGVRMDSAMELTWEEDDIPVVIVCAEPLEQPIHFQFSYQQRFRVTIVAVLIGADEADARNQADIYGGAILAAVVQDDTNLGGLAPRTDLILYPELAYADDTRRDLQAVTAEFSTLVTPVVNEAGRPPAATWPPPEISTVANTSFTFDPLPADSE